MMINSIWKGHPLTVNIRPNCLTISIEKPLGTDVFSFDTKGRLWTALRDGVAYRRGLDGKIIARWQTSKYAYQRRWLPPDECDLLLQAANHALTSLKQDLLNNQVFVPAHNLQDILKSLTQIEKFTPEEARRDIQKYYEVYKPVGILPPDQYMAVVLQATEGCSYNQCSFCQFYKDRPFHIKSPAEFERHAIAVRDFLGPGLSLRRTIFLGDANALVIPFHQLLPILHITRKVFDVDGLGGIFAFLDGFGGARHTSVEFSKMAELGVRRIYIGLESGSSELLQLLKKPGSPEDVIRTVHAMKEGGISTGIIVLLGAGGHHFAASHEADTIRVINQMRLDLDDVIYFSELVESEGISYVQDAYRHQLDPLTAEERQAQAERIESGLEFKDGSTPHISRYDIREFVY